MRWILIAACLLLSAVVEARVEIHDFASAEQAERYQRLIEELRCLVCQNQNIADSNADLAQDLRQQIYEMIGQGRSDREIIDYMVARYGDFVLYRPPFNPLTALLWLGPFLLLVVGLLVLLLVIRRRRHQAREALEPDERERVRKLLAERESDS